MQKETFYLLLFHGSAKETTKKAALRFCDTVCNKTEQKQLSLCFLKGHSPSFNEALEITLNRGYSSIVVYPMFILPGYHIDYEIPEIANEFMQKNAGTKVIVKPCLTEETYFANAIAELIDKNQNNYS